MTQNRTDHPRGAVALHDQANWNPLWRIERYAEDAAYAEFQARLAQQAERLQSDKGWMARVEQHRSALVLEKQRYAKLARFFDHLKDPGQFEAEAQWYQSAQGLVAVAKALLPDEARQEAARKLAYDVSEFANNGLANAGINELWSLVCGTGGVLFDNSNGYLGAGSSNTAFAAGQTDLQGGSKTRVGMEGGYPTYGTDQKATWQSSFDGNTGNHDWEEFGTFNHASAGDMLNRKTESEGTKTSGQTWVLTLDITLS